LLDRGTSNNNLSIWATTVNSDSDSSSTSHSNTNRWVNSTINIGTRNSSSNRSIGILSSNIVCIHGEGESIIITTIRSIGGDNSTNDNGLVGASRDSVITANEIAGVKHSTAISINRDRSGNLHTVNVQLDLLDQFISINSAFGLQGISAIIISINISIQSQGRNFDIIAST